jgi:cytidine deaminase
MNGRQLSAETCSIGWIKVRGESERQLLSLARRAALNAYAPYSKFRVGAAVLFDDADFLFSGCNIENTSYGLTMCAERVAIATAVAQNARRLVKIAVAVVDAAGQPIKSFMPCGACRQVIAEFGTPDTAVLIDNVTKLKLSDLLPAPFGNKYAIL